jgi:SNF2 family DNA or RNA helicase
MPSLVRAVIDRDSGRVSLSFPYDLDNIAIVKSIPGSRWDKQNKRWIVSLHGWEVMKCAMPHQVLSDQGSRTVELPEELTQRLRPYQVEAAEFMVRNPKSFLTMEMRTGKTPTAITALCGLFHAGQIQRALVTYPAGVAGEWERQLKEWAGIELYRLQGLSSLHQSEIDRLRDLPYLVIGCHYEILGTVEGDQFIRGRGADIAALLHGGQFAWIGDEVHQVKNRKAGRFKVLDAISKLPNAVAKYGLSGTIMRNRPRDLWGLFELIQAGSMGSYWTYAKRYCDAQRGEYGWVDLGISNDQELKQRLAAVSYRKTRSEVAAWLPKSDRSVIACAVPQAFMKKYRKLERTYAVEVKQALSHDLEDRDALRQLAQATSEAKIPTAYERACEHAGRGVKVIVFGHFHETVRGLSEYVENRYAELPGTETPAPVFCAGGWLTPEKRKVLIEQWKAAEGPAILLANSISSGIGIDLSDAEVAIFLELEWVPADFRQAEDRIQDMHLGKRTTPPIYEYLIVKDTIDEAMAGAMLKKIRSIEAVVGGDVETADVASTLRGSGVVGESRLGLPATDEITIAAALDSIRARWLAEAADDSDSGAQNESLAAAFADDWDDETSDDAESDNAEI